MAHTLSFTVLRQLHPIVGPIHKSINDLSEASIRSALREVVSNYLTHDGYFTPDEWSSYRGYLMTAVIQSYTTSLRLMKTVHDKSDDDSDSDEEVVEEIW